MTTEVIISFRNYLYILLVVAYKHKNEKKIAPMVNKFSVKKQHVTLTLYHTIITTFISVFQLYLRLDLT